MKAKRPKGTLFVACVAVLALAALPACSDDSSNTGGTGGGGTGGMAGVGGTGGMAGTGGTGAVAGAGGTGGTAGAGGMGGGANTPPTASIVDPEADSGNSDPDLTYDGFDDDMELWYKDVTVEGLGEDAEDGTLTGDSLVWKTNRTDIQPEVLGTGENPTIRLYSDDCFGVEHEVTLEATDSDGATTASEARKLFIWTLC